MIFVAHAVSTYILYRNKTSNSNNSFYFIVNVKTWIVYSISLLRHTVHTQLMLMYLFNFTSFVFLVYLCVAAMYYCFNHTCCMIEMFYDYFINIKDIHLNVKTTCLSVIWSTPNTQSSSLPSHYDRVVVETDFSHWLSTYGLRVGNVIVTINIS